MATLTKLTREYIDLDFAFLRHPMSHNLSIKKRENAIKQSIVNLLSLKEGDKPFHPEIKSPIYGFLFENASSIVQVVLESEIHKYLSLYEPRVHIHYVKVSYPNPNAINCEIMGQIVNVANPFTVNILIDRLR